MDILCNCISITKYWIYFVIQYFTKYIQYFIQFVLCLCSYMCNCSFFVVASYLFVVFFCCLVALGIIPPSAHEWVVLTPYFVKMIAPGRGNVRFLS